MVRLRGLETVSGASDDRPGETAFDRLTAAFLRLLSDHWVLTERMSNLEQALERAGVLDRAALELVGRAAEGDPERDRAAGEFVRRILDPLREPDARAG